MEATAEQTEENESPKVRDVTEEEGNCPDAVVGKEEGTFTHEEDVHEEESAHASRKGIGSGKPRQDLRDPSEAYAQGLNPTASVSFRTQSSSPLSLNVTPCSPALLLFSSSSYSSPSSCSSS